MSLAAGNVAKRARKRAQIAAYPQVKRVRAAILAVRSQLAEETEMERDDNMLRAVSDVSVGLINLVGSMAVSLERLAVAKEQEAQALKDLADRAMASEQD